MNPAGDGLAQHAAWAEALHAAALLAVDPAGCGGALLRAPAGEVRERWLQALRAQLDSATPWRRLPLHVGDERLLGGLDLPATLALGRPVAMRGLLAEADGGIVVAAMAERIGSATAARLAAVMDAGAVSVQRDGVAMQGPARFGLIALDEGADGDEHAPVALADRLAFHLDLGALSARHAFDAEIDEAMPDAAAVAAARARLPAVRVDDDIIAALTGAAMALGIASIRAALLALRAARAAAALAGRDSVTVEDAELAARLVLAPRATRLPPAPADDANEPPPPPPSEDKAERPDTDTPPQPDADTQPLPEQVLQAALSALPAGLLALIAAGGGGAPAAGGRAGALQASRLRGRPYGSRRGEPRSGARLHLIDTLRAAAPWQALRRRELDARHAAAAPGVLIRRDDFHVTRYRQRRETTTVFVVDASGSAALHRLAEAKGAVELLLADCYIRRDRVALIAFRSTPGGAGAEVLLPPTRSLVRAKRCLAALPGGGGTPLASGLDAARVLAEDVARRGGTPLVVLLTDGRANVARDGSGGRERAGADALDAARLWRSSGIGALWLDTSPQPHAQAREIASAMGARYLPLPHADARQVSQAVRGASA